MRERERKFSYGVYFSLIVSCPGASVVIILVHALFMTPPTQSSQHGDEEMGIVMEEISIS